MPNKQRIENLSRHKSENHPIISLYLNVTPPWQFKTKTNSLVRSQIKEVRENTKIPQQEIEDLEKLLVEIEDYIKNKEGSFKQTKLFVLFADTQGYWEEFALPVGHPSLLMVKPSPYIRPLRVLEEQFPTFCLVVGDSKVSKIYTYWSGSIVEKKVVRTEEEIIGETDEATGGFGEQRYQRYIKDHVLRHMKRTADIILEMFQNGEFDYLIVGATNTKNLATLKNNLHSYLKEVLVGEINAGPENNSETVRKKASKVASEWEKRKEKDIVDMLQENAYSDGYAVVGAGPTIKALMNGQVHTLVVKADAEKPGYVCPEDHYLSLSSEHCPFCNKELQKTENIIDEMVEETIAQSGEVKHLVNYGDQLEKKETGALLRFKI